MMWLNKESHLQKLNCENRRYMSFELFVTLSCSGPSLVGRKTKMEFPTSLFSK